MTGNSNSDPLKRLKAVTTDFVKLRVSRLDQLKNLIPCSLECPLSPNNDLDRDVSPKLKLYNCCPKARKKNKPIFGNFPQTWAVGQASD